MVEFVFSATQVEISEPEQGISITLSKINNVK